MGLMYWGILRSCLRLAMGYYFVSVGEEQRGERVKKAFIFCYHVSIYNVAFSLCMGQTRQAALSSFEIVGILLVS